MAEAEENWGLTKNNILILVFAKSPKKFKPFCYLLLLNILTVVKWLLSQIKYKTTYQFTLLCKGGQVLHPKQQKSFY